MKKIVLLSFVIVTLTSCTKKERISGDTLIENISIIDVVNNTVIANQDIVIKENKITHITKNSNSVIYDVAETISGTTQYILPG